MYVLAHTHASRVYIVEWSRVMWSVLIQKMLCIQSEYTYKKSDKEYANIWYMQSSHSDLIYFQYNVLKQSIHEATFVAGDKVT